MNVTRKIFEKNHTIEMKQEVVAQFTLDVNEVLENISTEKLLDEIRLREGLKPTKIQKLYEELRYKFNMSHFENKEDLRKTINIFLDEVNAY